MQELIRLKDVSCGPGSGQRLSKYNLTVFSGEIVSVLGIAGSGVSEVERLLMGGVPLDDGVIYVNEEPFKGQISQLPYTAGIFPMRPLQPLAERMSINDNLQAIRRISPVFSGYSETKAREDSLRILHEFGIERDPETLVQELSSLEGQLLCLAKAVAQGAHLILLDCTREVFADKDSEELFRYMKRLCKEGVSFLILSEQFTPFLDHSDRVQLLHHGKDFKEWAAPYFSRSILESVTFREDVTKTDMSVKGELLYLFAPEWDPKYNIFDFLRYFKRRYPEEWEMHLKDWEPVPGQYFDRGYVIVPHDSGELLLRNLSLEDNLSVCIPDRAGKWGGRLLHEGKRKLLAEDFLKAMGIETLIFSVDELDAAERKILSIYRWVLARPKLIFLEDPFWGLDVYESMRLRAYLDVAREQDMNFIIFTRNNSDVREGRKVSVMKIS